MEKLNRGDTPKKRSEAHENISRIAGDQAAENDEDLATRVRRHVTKYARGEVDGVLERRLPGRDVLFEQVDGFEVLLQVTRQRRHQLRALVAGDYQSELTDRVLVKVFVQERLEFTKKRNFIRPLHAV